MSADVAENNHASTSTLEPDSKDIVVEGENQDQDSKLAMAVKQSMKHLFAQSPINNSPCFT
jgi:hypothetical protein